MKREKTSNKQQTIKMMLTEFLQKILEFQTQMNKTNIMKEKEEVIKKYAQDDSDFVRLIELVYNPNIKFHLTKSKLQKYRETKQKDLIIENENLQIKDLFDLLGNISQRKFTGNKALEEMSMFLNQIKDIYHPIVFCIINKNLEVRCNFNTFKKHISSFSEQEFPVCLANNFTPKKFDEKLPWFISRKLDGVRCLVFWSKKDGVRVVTRSNKDITTLSLLIEELKNGIPSEEDDFILDGEVVVENEKAEESFKDVMCEIRKKNHTMQNFSFYCFDYIPLLEFKKENKKGMCFSERQNKLKSLFSYKNEWKFLRILEQTLYDQDTLDRMKKEVIEKNWEGLMIRQDSFYKGKRTNDLLKVKLFHDEDYIVKKIISGPFRIIDEKDKIEKTITMLSSIIVELDEKHDVNVGSGFSLEERQKYNTDPSLIVGKKVTIKFFEKTETSLRFPIFKGVREEGC